MQRQMRWLIQFAPRTNAARRTLYGYLFILPFILGFFLWFVAPIAVSAWMAFQDWNIINPPRFIWFENFTDILQDKLFWQALKVTAVYSLVSVPVGMLLSFSLALLLNTRVRGMAIFRTLFYLPVIVPAVANAVLWAWMLNTDFGLLNHILRSIGFTKIRWLVDPVMALPALIFVSLWTIGSSVVVFLAGLQGVPDVFYEAAEIDGAGRWAKLRHVTIPLMSPVIFFSLVMGVIGSFQVFAAGYLITGGGPNNATLFYVMHIYRTGFTYLRMGEASALAWILFVIILCFVALIFKNFNRSVHYE